VSFLCRGFAVVVSFRCRAFAVVCRAFTVELSSEMADRQFWGVVKHRLGSDARLQFEQCQPFGQNPKGTIGQNPIDL
jgi:hypothetical protein